MVEPWNFIGSYWWLIFPFLGVMGGVARAWERGARGRHARRLEILHAKAEIKAAQAAARGRGVAPSAVPASAAPAPSAAVDPDESQEAQLTRLFAAQDAVTKRWLDYELDVAKLIAFPAMSDGRQPLTAAFLRAKKVADGLRPASAKARLTKDHLAEYRNAVTDYEVAFDVAERDARRLKDSTFTDGERKRLDTAKQLLTVAIDQAATPAERQLAYRRVREELDGLISLSDGAVEVLETKVALELPATATRETQTPATDASAAPASAAAATPPAAPTGPATAPPTEAATPPAPWPIPSRSAKRPTS
ncbi:MAG: hypothetical protein J0J00_10115 [Microbacterium sp.]|nr:hypothetical protein [Microbacterium sp.]